MVVGFGRLVEREADAGHPAINATASRAPANATHRTSGAYGGTTR
jgi:hypothetical protein